MHAGRPHAKAVIPVTFASPATPKWTSPCRCQRRTTATCALNESKSGSRAEQAESLSEVSLSRRSLLAGFVALAAPGWLLGRTTPALAQTRTNQQPEVGYITPSGVRFIDFEVGTGDKPKWGDLVKINYALHTISKDGSELRTADTTFKDPNRFLLVHHGNGEMILGMEEMLHSMRVGGRRRAIIPQEMGYSQTGLGPVPPYHGARKKFINAINNGDGTVVVDLEIIETRPWDTRGYYTDLTPTPSEVTRMVQRHLNAQE